MAEGKAAAKEGKRKGSNAMLRTALPAQHVTESASLRIRGVQTQDRPFAFDRAHLRETARWDLWEVPRYYLHLLPDKRKGLFARRRGLRNGEQRFGSR